MKKSLLISFLVLASIWSYGQDKTKALSFNGNGDYVLIPHSSSLSLGRSDFTIEAWIDADTNNNSVLAPIILSKKAKTSASNEGLLFGLSDRGYLALQVVGVTFVPGFGPGSGVAPIDLRGAGCHHIAWTRETGGVEDTVRGYQDAAYVKKTKLPAQLLDINDNNDIWLGWSDFNGNANTYQYSGMIKEIRIWNYAKTEQEIWTDKNKHLKGDETGLIAYWRVNENFGDSVYDCTSNMNHGQIVSGTWASGCDVLGTMPSNCVPDTSDPGDTTSVESHLDLGKVEIYPNPSAGNLNISFPVTYHSINMRLYSVTGEMLGEWNLKDENEVSLRLEQDPGMYFLQIHSDHKTETYRVLLE